MQENFISFFNEKNENMRAALGREGALLSQMTRLGLPVPEGFTVTADACVAFYANGKQPGEALITQLVSAVRALEDQTGLRADDAKAQLLLSVRVSPVVPMPGLMEPVRYLGLTERIIAYDDFETYHKDAERLRLRFVRDYAHSVLGMAYGPFDRILEEKKEACGVSPAQELYAEDLKAVLSAYEALIEEAKKPFPQDLMIQLVEAVCAAFRSWEDPRAVVYRRDHGIAEEPRLAVNVQRMTYPTADENSGVGVSYARGPQAEKIDPEGDFLPQAGEEDLFAGLRAPMPLSRLNGRFPTLYQEMRAQMALLEEQIENLYAVSFALEKGKLWYTGVQTAEGLGSPAKREAGGGFEPSLDYGAHPTLSALPPELLQAQQALKADWLAGKNEYA